VALTPATGATNTGEGGETLNRTFLLWEKNFIFRLDKKAHLGDSAEPLPESRAVLAQWI